MVVVGAERWQWCNDGSANCGGDNVISGGVICTGSRGGVSVGETASVV